MKLESLLLWEEFLNKEIILNMQDGEKKEQSSSPLTNTAATSKPTPPPPAKVRDLFSKVHIFKQC